MFSCGAFRRLSLAVWAFEGYTFFLPACSLYILSASWEQVSTLCSAKANIAPVITTPFLPSVCILFTVRENYTAWNREGLESCRKILKNILYNAKVLQSSVGQEREKVAEAASLRPLGIGKTLLPYLSKWEQWMIQLWFQKVPLVAELEIQYRAKISTGNQVIKLLQ